MMHRGMSSQRARRVPWVLGVCVRGCVLGGLAGGLTGVLGGCASNPLNMRPGATSVFDAVRAPTPSEAVDMALDPYDPDRRYKGVLLLSKERFAAEDIYLNLFAERATDEDPGVRAAAIRALGLHGRQEHVPLIVKGVADADPSVRQEAARALQRIHDPVAVDALLVAMDRAKEPESFVRVEAARAIGQYAEPRVVEALIASLADDSLAVNAATLFSLRTLTGQDFHYDRAAWQVWYRGTSDYFAARSAYLYPGFQRGRKWYEYLPFVPSPPNEPKGLPVGMSPDMTASN
ncbi:MAG: HEAT repeat domain-containing protein [Planctomycetota bacterium]|nr:HEAT repeat domain-containing protein [Planctomycetota bacterium]